MPAETNIIVQVKASPAVSSSAFGPFVGSPSMGFDDVPGVRFDASFSPVPIPPLSSGKSGIASMAREFTNEQLATYIVRATVAEESLQRFISRSQDDPNVVGVFSDPQIQPIATCPTSPVGTDIDIEKLVSFKELQKRGMDGAGVKVVIVDTGLNLKYLEKRGKRPSFDKDLSWGPISGQTLGSMPVGHGTMCAYDVCIAAPSCELVDHALLTSQTVGGSAMAGLLSDAVASYSILLSYLTKAPTPFAGDHVPRTLVVNNSWGMFHPSWDFPIGSPQNYSSNPGHPFNIVVSSLEAAGADILFAAGNCGPQCPDTRCQGVTNAGIYGANSSSAVTCVAGVVINNDRIGYSTVGPGLLDNQKPDIACFTHFAGSGVFAADGGTSAATPVAAGVVAAIRRRYPSSILPPAQLRDILRETANSQDGGFNFEYGYGILNVEKLINKLEKTFAV